jgi:hypothetical protein
MDKAARRAAVAAYKERAPVAGVYVVRCATTGEAWVGATANLDTLKAQPFFSLRMGTHPNRSLQAAWNGHGEAAFALEVVERLAEDDLDYDRAALLRDRAAHWRGELGAARL